jgi:tRNA (guanine10-N2)-methyltransferase
MIDIDVAPLRGTCERNLQSNFDQYGLPCPDVLQWDVSHAAATVARSFWDAIVCDPPYGLRAGARKVSRVGPLQNEAKTASLSKNKTRQEGRLHVYEPEAVLGDLLDLSASRLVLHGRLVYVLACKTRAAGDYAPYVPIHPSLEVRHVCVQKITRKTVRLFITMEKIKEHVMGEKSVLRPQLDLGW